jgi:SAM-dependent methyltransferase
MQPEPIFDHRRLSARIARARRMALPGSDFLVRHAAEEIADRLSVTNRTFRRCLDLFSISPALRETIAGRFPDMEIVAFDRVPGANQEEPGPEPGSPEGYDLVVSAFGLHWCNDLLGMLARIRLVLKPDGLFMAVIPGDGTLGELRKALVSAETALCGGAAMRVDPFVEVRQAGQLLQRAGFALPVADAETLALSYSELAGIFRDIRGMGVANALCGPVKALPRGIRNALEVAYPRSGERLVATANLVYLTAWAPHESQQKPLRPGSAAMRLSDALKP